MASVEGNVLDRGRTTLEAAGFQIAQARGWEAISRCGRSNASLVLVDSGLASESWVRLCETLRRCPGNEANGLVVLCRRSEDIPVALDAGADDVLRWPINWREAGHRLRRLAQARSLDARVAELQARLDSAVQSADVARAEADRLRQFDLLTGLPARGPFFRLVEQSFAHSRGPGSGVALLLLDLDRFTAVNDALGRKGGAAVLRETAARLSTWLRAEEGEENRGTNPLFRAVARVGADEFAVLLTSVADPTRVTRFANDLRRALARGFAFEGQEIYLSASLGVALSSAGASGADELFRQAESALAEAKTSGGGGYRLYSDARHAATNRRFELDRKLRRAFERGELLVHYQPVADAESGRVVAAEALLRWHDAAEGWISPAEFVPIAEETGLMADIDGWVLLQSCRQLRRWLDSGLPPIRIAVNVSRCQLERGDLVELAQSALSECRIEPSLLELELSERGALSNVPSVLEQLHELRELGVRILVDDFGTGDSSITYLRSFPIDGLKIDRSFVRDVAVNEDDANLTAAIVAMAHKLRLSVVAEGVEAEPQLERLKSFGCEEFQGYLIAPALAADEFLTQSLARGVLPAVRHAEPRVVQKLA